MFNHQNVVKDLESKGIIAEGKYAAAIISKSQDMIVVAGNEAKFGLLSIDGKLSITPKFDCIIQDKFGHYVCYGKVDGKVYTETYDKNLNRVS